MRALLKPGDHVVSGDWHKAHMVAFLVYKISHAISCSPPRTVPPSRPAYLHLPIPPVPIPPVRIPPVPPPQICTFPGYQSLYSIAQSLGCRVSLWEPGPASWQPPAEAEAAEAEADEVSAPSAPPLVTSTGLRFDVGCLESMLRAEAPGSVRLVVVNFPHNPVGEIPDGSG